MRTGYKEQYAACADEVLLQFVMQEDMDAFEMLYDRHAPKLYALLRRIVLDESIAEELLQDTFWRIWQKAEQYSGAGSGAAWLHRLARNKALDQLRRQKVRSSSLIDAIETFEALPQLQQHSAEREFEQEWTNQQLHQALATIPSEQRLCLELAYFEGLSQQEIAQRTHTSIGTIKTRTRIGIKKMKRCLLGVGYMNKVS